LSIPPPLPAPPGKPPPPPLPGKPLPKVNDDLIHFYGQNIIPKLPNETDMHWLARIKGNPVSLSLVKIAINKAPLSEQIRLLAMRRAQAVAGDQRSYAAAAGPNNAATMAGRYQQDLLSGLSHDKWMKDTDAKLYPRSPALLDIDEAIKNFVNQPWKSCDCGLDVDACSRTCPTSTWQAIKKALEAWKADETRRGRRWQDSRCKRGVIELDNALDRIKRVGGSFAEQQVNFLANDFTYDTPKSGSVFWSTVDPNKLAQQVKQWNNQYGSTLFGQLEATTDARFMNNAFKCKTGPDYWSAASERYGGGATGHVTSVQMWGVRRGSVFEITELPRILNGMDEQLRKGEKPRVTDISIVVLDPMKHNEGCRIFTNRDIRYIRVFNNIGKDKNGKLKQFATCKEDCGDAGDLSSKIPQSVSHYWAMRPNPGPSEAAKQIQRDYPKIKR
jgi:hypothetical protein